MRFGRAITLLTLLALIVGMGPAAWSQQIPRATCLDCHEQEGMQYAVLQATPFIEIPTGQTHDLAVTVANPWLHEITSAKVTLDLSNATGLSFDTPDPLHLNETFTLDPRGPSAVNVSFPILPGATGLVTKMVQPEDGSGAGLTDVDTSLITPTGAAIPARPDGVSTTNPNQNPRAARTVEQIAPQEEQLAETGGWNLSIQLANGPPDTTAEITVDVFYNATRTQSLLLRQTINQGETMDATFQVKGVEQGDVTIEYETIVTSYYKHPGGIGAQDEGNTTLEGAIEFTVGEQLELGEAGPVVPATPPVNWKMNARIWGEATGFIGLFMVPLSLVLGGAFGRRNVLWVNKVTQSARLRVLWHNALSFALLGISLLHLALFLYEPVYDWSVGMVWGGLGTLSLIGLGITGGFQRRMARSLGYGTWRLLHIAMAVGFVAATLAHVLIDGAHFDFLRQWMNLT